ncbi:hypothetical protein BpHYR1_005575 [Brachionus plicatilis]|uniref:Uncharacterized protein n=1 Tax=Brachionus plicatilis TaxID=10195 RepID=A0A3M7SLN7_BRAPC|nr:hypothetical protein BpHYR1_005575 [Brachionus plicatilis]
MISKHVSSRGFGSRIFYFNFLGIMIEKRRFNFRFTFQIKISAEYVKSKNVTLHYFYGLCLKRTNPLKKHNIFYTLY